MVSLLRLIPLLTVIDVNNAKNYVPLTTPKTVSINVEPPIHVVNTILSALVEGRASSFAWTETDPIC